MSKDANNQIIRTGYFRGKELTDKMLVFPYDLGRDEDAIKNCIMFSIFNYSGGGYNRLSKDGSSDLISKPVGDRKLTIYLPMPGRVGVNESANWSQSDKVGGDIVAASSVVQNILKTSSSFGSAIDNLVKMAGDSMGSVMNGVLTSVVKNRIHTNQYARNSIGAAAGVSLQPYEEVLFDNIRFRTFNFSFLMVPRNDKELQTISDIVQSFRWASKPGLTGLFGDDNFIGDKVFTYPNVFQIRYLIAKDETKENQWLNKFQPAVCTRVEVEYGGDQSRNYMSFVPNSHPLRKTDDRSIDPEGAPIFYRITLSFSELAYVTKESINQGY